MARGTCKQIQKTKQKRRSHRSQGVTYHGETPQNTIKISRIPNGTTKEELFEFLDGQEITNVKKRVSADFNEKENSVIISFKRSKMAKKVMTKVPLVFKDTKLQVEWMKMGERTALGQFQTECVIEVRNFDPSIRSERLELHFEKKRISGGGGVKSIELHRDEGYALVTFSSEIVARRVLKTQQIIDNKTLTLKMHVPPPPSNCYGNRVCIRNKGKDITDRNLKELFLERAMVAPKQIFHFGEDIVLLEFDTDVDIRRMKSLFKGRVEHDFTIEPVPMTDTVLVYTDGVLLTNNSLRNYFENSEETRPKKIVKTKEENRYLIQFGDHSVVDEVCKQGRNHHLDGNPLHLEPYYPSIHFALESEEMEDKLRVAYMFKEQRNIDPLSYLDCSGSPLVAQRNRFKSIPFDIITDERIEGLYNCKLIDLLEKLQIDINRLLNSQGFKSRILDTLLIEVVKNMNDEFLGLLIIYSLLCLGAHINTFDKNWNTPLQLAILGRKCLTARFLLQQTDVNVFHRNERYQNCLILAENKNSIEIIKSLWWYFARKFNQKYLKQCEYLHVWPGYHYPAIDEAERYGGKCLVAEYDGLKTGNLTDNFHDVNVICRSAHQTSSESRYIASLEVRATDYGNLKAKSISSCVSRNSAMQLFQSHSNLNIINRSNFKSTRFGSYDPEILPQKCITFHCRVKGIIPLGEFPFPTVIECCPTDVREGYCEFGTNGPNDYHPNLKYGCCIGPVDGSKSGTLGGFVEHNGEDYFITCAHVLYGLNQPVDQPVFVVQPTTSNVYSPQQRIIGKTIDAKFQTGIHNQVSIDAALVKIDDRAPVNGIFPSETQTKLIVAGYSPDKQPLYLTGKVMEYIPENNVRSDVIKFGAVTGLTRGSLSLDRSHVRIESKEMKIHKFNIFDKQILSEPFTLYSQYEVYKNTDNIFFDSGDSGSFAFILKDNKSDNLQCFGMCIGKTSYDSCIITPIPDILKTFGLKMQLKSFQDTNNNPHNSELNRLTNLTLNEQSYAGRGIPTSTNTHNIEQMLQVIAGQVANMDQRLTGQLADINNRVTSLELKMDNMSQASQTQRETLLCDRSRLNNYMDNDSDMM